MKPDYELKPAMKKMQIQSLRKEQIKPIQSILKGQDTIVSAPTSMGKSLIYQLPALVHSHQLTVVIEPTLALIYDQVKKLQELEISADYLDHTRSKLEEISVFDALSKGRLTLLYVTPERLQSTRFQSALSMCDLYMVVIDECHCIPSGDIHSARLTYRSGILSRSYRESRLCLLVQQPSKNIQLKICRTNCIWILPNGFAVT